MNSTDPIVCRNRRNALLSTGPISTAGKDQSRLNSRRHGLTSNPVAGTIEDRQRFEKLLTVLRDELEPVSVVEDLIVQRIAVAAWRLERCALADSAIWDTAINNTPPARHEVHDFIEQIMNYWQPEFIEEHDVPDAEYRRAQKLPPIRVWVRRRLRSLDDYRKNELMQRGSGIMAMVAIIEELIHLLGTDSPRFSRFDAERLAWALGEDAGRLEFKEDKAKFPGEYDRASDIDRLILAAAQRNRSEPIPDVLLREVDRRVLTLRAQAQTCEFPYADEAWQQRWRQSPFAGESVLERLLRYETHAERGLHKNLEALARLRGTSIQTVVASVRHKGAEQTDLLLWGQQTRSLE